MAESIDIGLTLTAIDRLTGVVDKMANNTKGSLQKIEKSAGSMALKGANSFTKFALGIISLNQAFSLAKKGIRLLESGFEATVGASLASRAATDSQRSAWDEMSKSTSALSIQIGDILMPIVAGVADAIKKATSDFSKWIKANEDFLKTGSIEAFVTLGRVMVSIVATGAVTAAIAFTRLVQVFSFLRASWAIFNMLAMKGLAAITGAAAKVANAVGLSGIGGALKDVTSNLSGMGDEWDATITAMAKSIVADERALNDMIATTDKVVDVANEGIGGAAVAAFKHLGDTIKKDPDAATKAFNKELDEIFKKAAHLAALRSSFKEVKIAINESAQATSLATKNLEGLAQGTEDTAKAQMAADDRVFAKATENQAGLKAAWDLYYKRQREAGEEGAKFFKITNADVLRDLQKANDEADKDRVDELADKYEKLGQTMKSSLKSAFSELAEGSVTFGQFLGKVFGNIASSYADMIADMLIKDAARNVASAVLGKKLIQSEAAKAAASAFKSVMEVVPFPINVILAPIVAAGAFVAVTAFEALGGFAAGGMVTGGIRGRDSVPAMLMPGEYVLPTHVVDSIRSGTPPSRSGQFASGGMVTGGGRMAAPVQMNFMAFTSSRAQVRKLERDVFSPERNRLKRNRSRFVREG